MHYIAEKGIGYKRFSALRSAGGLKYRGVLMVGCSVGIYMHITRRGRDKLRSPLDDLDDI
jgi:hypothetical protein